MKILDIAYALPSAKVTNQELIKRILEANRKRLSQAELKSVEAKIKRFFKVSGTVVRYHRGIGERALDFAVQAGKEVLKRSKINPRDVDLLIYTGVGRGWVEPAMANLFQSELGLSSATCFDVMDACASWIRSISIAKTFVAQKIYKLVMVLNCECNFREYVNLELESEKDLETSFSGFTIGEAATATLIAADDGDDDSHFSFRTWGEKHGLCKIPLPNADDFSPSNGADRLRPMSFFTMPAELLSFTCKNLVEHFRETQVLANQAHDLIVGHAVSNSSTAKVARLLNFDRSRVFETHSRFGNTVSASLPLALAVAEREGRLKRGMRVLLLMGSAGVSTAVGSFTY